MAKRKSDEEIPQTARFSKRQKPAPSAEGQPFKEILNGRHIRTLLAFYQDDLDQLRDGIQIFKQFLESIIYPEDPEIVSRQKSILREYLDSEKSDSATGGASYLSDIFQAWDFSSTANHEALFSAIASILALCVKTLSSDIILRDHCQGICSKVLEQEQLKLIARGLSREKSKAYVVSPCLRLLTEIVSFDGGLLARQVFQKRDLTFDTKTLTRNLYWRDHREGLSDEERKKPTVRSNAVRYLLANLRFQHHTIKVDLLKQGNVVKALFESIETDPPSLAIEILSSLKKYVIYDKNLPQGQKSYVFNEDNLRSLYKLWTSTTTGENITFDGQACNDTVRDFLYLLCTDANAGVLRSSQGWYPRIKSHEQTQNGTETSQHSTIKRNDLESYLPEGERIPIRNISLANFAQGLRPYASDEECKMLIAIFKAAPELVADYYQKKKSFAFTPKLTSTWIGYASVLFQTVQCPIPEYFGRQDSHATLPPPISIVIESILPQPLTQLVLSKCVNSDSDMIRLFAVRILSASLMKLQEVAEQLHSLADTRSEVWDQAADDLISEFSRRFPPMKDVIHAFRKTQDSKPILREATTRLLSLYYDVLPQVALEEKFDTTVALNTLLEDIGGSDSTVADYGLRMTQLKHLLKIALWCRQDITWYKRHQNLKYSLFVTLLKVAALKGDHESTVFRSVLTLAIRDTGWLQTKTTPSAVDALIASLKGKDSDSLDDIFAMLDDCLQRLMARPIVYLDNINGLSLGNQMDDVESGSFSILLMPILEQWPHRQKLRSDTTKRLAQWIHDLFNLLKHIGEDNVLLGLWLAALRKATPDQAIREALSAPLEIKSFEHFQVSVTHKLTRQVSEKIDALSAEKPGISSNYKIACLSPPSEDEKHSALSKFQKASADLQLYIEDGSLGPLLLYLGSPDLSIRRQTIILLRKLVSQMKESNYTEVPMLRLMIGALIETYEAYPSQQHENDELVAKELALPYMPLCFAVHALPVITDPSAAIYPKLCAFLCRRPEWIPSQQLSQLTADIMQHPPADSDNDGSHYRELVWLLEWVYDGIRTGADVDLLRRSNTIDKLCTLWSHESLARFKRLDVANADDDGITTGGSKSSGSLQSRVRSLIINIIGRTALIEEGATMLATRTGALAWMKAVREQGSVDADGKAWLLAIEQGILQYADKSRLLAWSSGMCGGEAGMNGDADNMEIIANDLNGGSDSFHGDSDTPNDDFNLTRDSSSSDNHDEMEIT